MTTEPSSIMQAMVEAGGVEPGTMLGADMDAEQLDLLRDPETGKLPADVYRLARNRAAGRGRGRPPGSRNKKSDQIARLIVEKYGDPLEAMAELYAMPSDQLVELLLIADGSKDREERLFDLVENTRAMVNRLYDEAGVQTISDKKLDKLSDLMDRVGDLAKVLKSKPGELALKARAMQLAASREVAMYVHSKRPIAVDVTKRADVILNIPGLTDPAHLRELVNDGNLSEDDLARLEYTPFSEVPE